MILKRSIIFLLIITAHNILSQEISSLNEIEELSLKTAVDYGLKNNPEINKISEQINIKNGEWWNSFGFESPILSYTKEGIEKNKNNFAEQKWNLQQSIDFPLTTYFRLNRISNEKNALEEQLNHNKRELVASVKTKYVDVLYSRRMVDLRQKQINLAEKVKKTATTKLEAGEISELEVMKSEIQLAEAHNLFEDANQLYHKSRYILFNTIGLDPSLQKYQINFDDTLFINPENISQTAVLENLDKQPLITSYKNSLAATSSQINEAWSSFLPRINLSYFYQDFGTGYDYNGFELGVSLPLWFIFNQNGDIQIAKAKNREIEWSVQETKLNMKTEIEHAWHGYEANKQKIQTYETTIRTNAEELLNLTLLGYQLGELDLLRLLDAQQTYLNSEINFYGALKDYYNQLIQLEKYLDKEIVF